MKSIKYFFVAFILACSATLVAQTIIKVAPGYGTLNDAITANGSATYSLQPGGWYGLNQTLEIDVPIQIIGRDSAGMPAMIQTGSTAAGATFTNMFTLFNNLTLKNVYIINADLNDGEGMGVFNLSGPDRLVVDSVTFDPLGSTYLVLKTNDTVSTYFTNSLFMRHGNTVSVNDGWIFCNMTGGPWDTLYVENNTFVDVGTNFMITTTVTDKENLIWINHNTFMFGKANFYEAWGSDKTFITNNLFWQYDFHPIQYAWANYFPDANFSRVQGMILDDTLANETLPSTRKHFVEYNSNYRSQGIWDLVKYLNDQGWAPAYLYDFIPSAKFIDSCRETVMYNDKTHFPGFFYNNNISDYGAENTAHDPNFTDQKIYTLTDSAIAWATQSAYQQWGHQASDPSTWKSYFYNTDPKMGNPVTWPRFDGSYTNSTLLTASIEKLPLGDLNWFPTQKKVWDAHQTEVMDYILAENETQTNITAVEKNTKNVPVSFSLSQNYPNPFNPSTVISYTVPKESQITLKIFNVLGQEVTTLVNSVQKAGTYNINFNASKLSSGIYFYSIKANGFTSTKKMMLVK
jgi:hypothetical protein